MTKVEFYITEDGRQFQFEADADRYEKERRRVLELLDYPQKERMLLIEDINRAFEVASSPGIVDTNSVGGRQIIYIKEVCQRFLDKHKDCCTI